MGAQKTFLYTGSWGNREQKGHGTGVSVFRFNSDNGAFDFEMTLPVDEPGILAVSPDKRFLYAVNEMTVFPDGEFATGGGVTAMRIDPESGHLCRINQTCALGSLPAYLTVDPTGEFVCCAIHGSFAVTSRYVRQEDGSFRCVKTFDTSGVSLFRVREDGGVLPGCDLDIYQTVGSYETYKHDLSLANHGFPGSRVAPPEIFQTRPHAHSINFHPCGLGVVCERGSDMLYLYEIDREAGLLRRVFSYHARLGTAPRHLAFHPTLPYFYITNEMESSVTVFRFDPAGKSFSEIQSIRTLPKNATCKNAPSDIHVHPSGRFVYASNRGDDSIAVYRVDEETGLLAVQQILPLGEPSPRGFDISPDGAFLVVGNMDSDRLASYRIDGQTGELTDSGQRAQAATPTCVRFVTL